MAKYRKKPVVIEAIKYTEDNLHEALQFLPVGKWRLDGKDLYIKTLEGDHFCTPGDFIIQGARGDDYYPCKPDIFEMTYEKVEQINLNVVKNEESAQDARKT